MSKINRIRKMIERFTQTPNEEYQVHLAKCAKLLELDAELNEIEELMDTEEDPIYEEQINSIGKEVRKVIWLR